MAVLLIILGVLFWIGCGVVSYLMFRGGMRVQSGHWTCNDRATGLVLAFLGPMAVAAAILMFGLPPYNGGSKPASW